MHVRRGTPVVSVIIPAHNAASFVVDAIRSVHAQTVTDHEVIVVDDGSTDGTQEVLLEVPGVRIWRQANGGAAAARNAGISLAAGEFICFLDADDLWLPDKLARQLAFMGGHPDVGLLFADASEWRGELVEKPSILATMAFGADARTQVPIADAFGKLLMENFIPTSTVMIRRSCLAATGPFDVDLPNAEDRDMWLRVAAHAPMACVPDVLARKRSHGANISARIELALNARIRVWEKCRQQFPSLAAAAVYDRLLGETYQQLGYLLLEDGRGRAARTCATRSLMHAARHAVKTAQPFAHRWRLSFGLLALSFMRRRLVHALWQARHALRRRRIASSTAVPIGTSPRLKQIP